MGLSPGYIKVRSLVIDEISQPFYPSPKFYLYAFQDFVNNGASISTDGRISNQNHGWRLDIPMGGCWEDTGFGSFPLTDEELKDLYETILAVMVL